MVSNDVKPHYSSLFYTVCSENNSLGSVRLVALHSIVVVSDDVKSQYSSLFYTVCSENKSRGSVRLVALHSHSHG